jgi:hypothetical protein
MQYKHLGEKEFTTWIQLVYLPDAVLLYTMP